MQFGLSAPRVAVAGLNPHAGEGGMMGTEERSVIAPAIERLRAEGHCRLRPIAAIPLKPLAALVATFHIGDPVGPRDSWRPWRRRVAVKAELKIVVAALKKARLARTQSRPGAKSV